MKLIYKTFGVVLFSIFFIINVNASSYKIEELGLNVIVPEGFYSINRSSSTSDIQSLNLDPAFIKERMLSFNSYLLLYNFESEIHISKIENTFTQKINNLVDSSNEIIKSLGDGYSKEFGEYEIYETDVAKFFVFEYSLDTLNGTYYYLKYKTIVNGVEITVNNINPTDFSSTNKHQMLRIINSMKFDNNVRQKESDSNLIYIIGLVLFIVISTLIYLKNKKHL